MSTSPWPLPHQLFLLTLHPAKGRADDDSAAVRGSLLSAAAVAELCLTGRLRDSGGKAQRTDSPETTPLGPFLTAVLDEVPPERPSSWFEVLERRSPTAEKLVEDELDAAGAIRVGYRRILGPIRTKRIHLVSPEPVEALRERVRDAARRDPGSGPAPIGDSVLAALAIDGNVSTVFGWRDLVGHRNASRAMKDRIDYEMSGLRPALLESIALRRAG
jgi:hypothetical protein